MFKETPVPPDGVEMVFSSDMATVDRALDAFQRRFNRWSSGDRFNAALVLRELLTNAVAHGNCMEPDRVVSCRIEPAPRNRMKIVVADEGDGFSREGMTFEMPADPLTDRHRGLALVHAYSETVAFNAAGNQVAVQMKCAAPEDGVDGDKGNRMERDGKATPSMATGAPGKRMRVVEEDASIRITMASDRSLVERALRSISAFVDELEMAEGGAEGQRERGTEGQRGFPELEQALRELLINAVVHGNGEQADKQVVCEISQVGADLYRGSVTDEGEGFDHRNAPALTSRTPQWEGGGGLALVRSLCEQLDFNEAGNAAVVYMRRQRQTRYDVSMEGDRAVIRPGGNITAASAPELKQRLLALIERGTTRFSFDFSRVAEIDSMSLTVFVVLVKMLAKRDVQAELEIVNSNDNIRKLFSLTRLDSHYMMM